MMMIKVSERRQQNERDRWIEKNCNLFKKKSVKKENNFVITQQKERKKKFHCKCSQYSYNKNKQ